MEKLGSAISMVTWTMGVNKLRIVADCIDVFINQWNVAWDYVKNDGNIEFFNSWKVVGHYSDKISENRNRFRIQANLTFQAMRMLEVFSNLVIFVALKIQNFARI